MKTNNITRQFAMSQQLNRRFGTKITIGNGVTPEMVKDATREVMSHSRNYSDMSAEDMAKAVNCITCCERFCN